MLTRMLSAVVGFFLSLVKRQEATSDSDTVPLRRARW